MKRAVIWKAARVREGHGESPARRDVARIPRASVGRAGVRRVVVVGPRHRVALRD